MNKNNFWWTPEKCLSYNALLYFVIGERGVGKSYGMKAFEIEHFLKTGKQFAYIRRYKEELKQALYKNKSPYYFHQLNNDERFKNINLTNKYDAMYINDKLAGFAMPLSTANILKSSDFSEVDTIVFDEFLIDKGAYHYLHDEVIQFLDIIETIARLRDIRVFLLGNAISITNPYFDFFNLHLPYNSEYATFKNGLIVVNYIKNEAYRQAKKKSRFGQLIEGTRYGNYAIDNQFLRDNQTFISKKSSNSKFFFTFQLNGEKFGIWRDYELDNIYISKDYDPKSKLVFTLNWENHNEHTILLKASKTVFFRFNC